MNTFRFKPGDQVLSYGITHWTNHDPLTVVKLHDQSFTGITREGTEFTYHMGPGAVNLHWRRYMRYEEPDIFVPSVDVCAYCGDGECAGDCFMHLDPNYELDQPEFERVQQLIRWGHIWEAAQAALARAENR